MASTAHGPHLWKQFHAKKATRDLTLHCVKKPRERMLREHLGVANSLCKCLWTCCVLRQKDIVEDHDNMCDLAWHDHKGWERSSGELWLWLQWSTYNGSSSGKQNPDIPWSASKNRELASPWPTPRWPCRALVGTSWAIVHSCIIMLLSCSI